MEKTAKLNRFCAIVFVLALCALFSFNGMQWYRETGKQIKTMIESRFSHPPYENILKNMFWSYLKLTNRKSVNGVIIMNDGRLVHDLTSNPPLLAERAGVIVSLNNYLHKKDTPFLFIRAPNPMKDNTQMPKGFETTVIEDGLRFMSILGEANVDTLDFREEMERENINFSTAFFWGDHHWTAETALWAYGKTGTLMNEKYGFEMDKKTWNPEEYKTTVFHKTFLGLASTRIGDAGLKEDLSILSPKFPTEFEAYDRITEESKGGGKALLASGDFIDVFTPGIRIDNYQAVSYYALNAVGESDYRIKRYINKLAQDHKRILVIADSYAFPFVTYLSTALKSVDYMYLYWGEINEKVYSFLESEDYDLVMYLAYDGSILSGGNDITKDRMYLGEPPM